MPDLVTKILLEFLSLSKNLLVLFLGISFFISFIQAYVPFEKVEKWMGSRNPFLGNLAGALLGFITPFCSCSTIPLLVTMLNRNVPFQTVMTYLFTSPLLDPWIIGLMAYIYGVKVTAVYTITTFVFSMIIGWYLDKNNYKDQVRNVVVKGGLPEQDERRRKSLVLNIKESIKETIDLIRSVVVYILIGAFVGAIIKEAVPTNFLTFISDQNQWWVIPLAAIIGVPLYIRLSTMLPIAQALLVNGFPIAPTMALLIGGAGASLPEIIMLKSIFRKKLVGAFIVSVFLMATVSGYLFLVLEL
ncbi:permease [Priestia megaterium]|uniref:permease n=1 Tax=Priestia megaterium TaxID=1404 RepID=UPI002877320F|nr:permease [Priestia megaterium]MBX4163335.1 permease [Priestia megaterium]